MSEFYHKYQVFTQERPPKEVYLTNSSDFSFKKPDELLDAANDSDDTPPPSTLALLSFVGVGFALLTILGFMIYPIATGTMGADTATIVYDLHFTAAFSVITGFANFALNSADYLQSLGFSSFVIIMGSMGF